MADCVFCKICDGQIPSTKIYEDERTLCIMDINPLNAGHCLVLTKTHAATIFEAQLVDLQAAIATAQRVAMAQRRALKEVWGTGTAAVISPVGELAHRGERIVINQGKIGELTQKLYDAIVGIQYGTAPDTHGWTVGVE